MDRVKLATGIVAAVLALIVVAQNWRDVEVFIFFRFEMNLTILLLLTYVLGGVSAWAFTWWRHRHPKK